MTLWGISLGPQRRAIIAMKYENIHEYDFINWSNNQVKWKWVHIFFKQGVPKYPSLISMYSTEDWEQMGAPCRLNSRS